MRRLICWGMLALTLTGALRAENDNRPSASAGLPDGLYAEFSTAHGPVVVELAAAKVPLTVTHFVGLAEGTLGPTPGQPYYAGLRWYRVVPGFVIQSGNPNHPEESNAGAPFPDEFVPGLRHGEAGILSMANAGPDTNSGEFFLTLGDQTRLNYLHSVFGRTVRGVEFLPLIKPDEPFRITIRRIGAAAQAFKADAATFAALRMQAKPYVGETETGPTAHCYDPDHLLPTEPPRAAAFNFKLNNFERTTGIKVMLRLAAAEPPADEDSGPGVYMQALAKKLGTEQRGVVVAYFAAEDDWRVWFGRETTSSLLGRSAQPADLVTDGAFHDAKEALINAALTRGDAAFLAQKQAAAPGLEPNAAHHLKLKLDALLDALLFKLEP